MSVAVAVAEWIKVVAADERKREANRLAEDEVIARKADAVRRDGRRLVDELRAVMTRDVQAFCDEFAGDATRAIAAEATGPNGGFVVRKPAPAAVSLALTPNLDTASMPCHYRFTLTNGLPPREDRIDIVFAAELPKTRSGKIMRRLLKDIAEGRALGDTTTLADPAVIQALKQRYQED